MIPVYVIFSFVSLFIFLWVVISSVRNPFKRMLETRKVNIEEEIGRARNAQKEATIFFQTFRSKLSGLESEQKSMRLRLEEDLKNMEKRMVSVAQATAQRIKENTKLTVLQEERAALDRIKSQTAVLAIQIAREKIEKHITPKDDYRLQDEAIENMGQPKYGQSISREALCESSV